METTDQEAPLVEYDDASFRKLGATRKRLIQQLADLDELLKPHIAAARAADVPVTTIKAVTGYKSREYIRTITREHGVEAPESWSRSKPRGKRG
jgi:hypothetical protein